MIRNVCQFLQNNLAFTKLLLNSYCSIFSTKNISSENSGQHVVTGQAEPDLSCRKRKENESKTTHVATSDLTNPVSAYWPDFSKKIHLNCEFVNIGYVCENGQTLGIKLQFPLSKIIYIQVEAQWFVSQLVNPEKKITDIFCFWFMTNLGNPKCNNEFCRTRFLTIFSTPRAVD